MGAGHSRFAARMLREDAQAKAMQKSRIVPLMQRSYDFHSEAHVGAVQPWTVVSVCDSVFEPLLWVKGGNELKFDGLNMPISGQCSEGQRHLAREPVRHLRTGPAGKRFGRRTEGSQK